MVYKRFVNFQVIGGSNRSKFLLNIKFIHTLAGVVKLDVILVSKV